MKEPKLPFLEFRHNEMNLTLFGDNWNGKELLYINNELVSERRNFRFKSDHVFSWNNSQWVFSFELDVHNGVANCTLAEGEQVHWQGDLPFRYDGKLGELIQQSSVNEAESMEPAKPEETKPRSDSRWFAIAAIALKLFKSAKGIQIALVGASVASYSFLFDWRFAVIIVMALMFHEFGHMQAMKKMGMKVKGMYLIPFIGGAAVSADKINTRWENVFISMMGPVYGLLLTLVFFGVYLVTDHSLAAGLASFSALLNLINLLPIFPLDGGHVVKSIAFSLHSKIGLAVLWLGVILSVVITWNIGLSLFAFLTVIGALDLLFGRNEGAHAMKPLNNSGIIISAAWYLGTIAALIGMIILMSNMGMAGSQLVTTILNS